MNTLIDSMPPMQQSMLPPLADQSGKSTRKWVFMGTGIGVVLLVLCLLSSLLYTQGL